VPKPSFLTITPSPRFSGLLAAFSAKREERSDVGYLKIVNNVIFLRWR